MQISSDLKSLELLGISGKGRLQFCEDLEFLGIPRNSLEFLGIPWNSMLISSDLKSLELLGTSGKGQLQFCEDLELLGMPWKSQLYKLQMKSTSHTSIITALKFTPCSSLSQLSTKLFYTLDHCFKFSGNDRLRNRDSSVGTCC